MADKYSQLKVQLKARLEALRKRLTELEQTQKASAPSHVRERSPGIAGGAEDRQ
jgi:hypothetical protein